MKKKPALQSAFFNRRLLVSLALSSIGLLLALLAFALYPGGNALAQNQSSPEISTEQDLVAPEIQEPPLSLGSTEISLAQDPALTLQPNDSATPLVNSCTVTVLPNNGGLSANERAPHI